MKDKRQRMALAWPYGIADPHLYAYLAAAAASYPYSLPHPQPAQGLGGYPQATPLSRVTPPHAGFSPTGLPVSPSSRPAVNPSDLLGNLANTYLRPNSMHSFGIGVPQSGMAQLPPTHPHSHLMRQPVDPASISLLAAHASSAPGLTSSGVPGHHVSHSSPYLSSIDSARLAAVAAASGLPATTPVSHSYSPVSSRHTVSPQHTVSPLHTVSPQHIQPNPSHQSTSPTHSLRHSTSPPQSQLLNTHARRDSPPIHAPKPTKPASTSTGAPKGIFRPFQTEIEQS